MDRAEEVSPMSGSDTQSAPTTSNVLVGNPRRTRGLDESMLRAAPVEQHLVGNPRRTRGLIEI